MHCSPADRVQHLTHGHKWARSAALACQMALGAHGSTARRSEKLDLQHLDKLSSKLCSMNVASEADQR